MCLLWDDSMERIQHSESDKLFLKPGWRDYNECINGGFDSTFPIKFWSRISIFQLDSHEKWDLKLLLAPHSTFVAIRGEDTAPYYDQVQKMACKPSVSLVSSWKTASFAATPSEQSAEAVNSPTYSSWPIQPLHGKHTAQI